MEKRTTHLKADDFFSSLVSTAAATIYRLAARAGKVPALNPPHRPQRDHRIAREAAWRRSAGLKLISIGRYVKNATGGSVSSRKLLEKLAVTYIEIGRKLRDQEIRTVEEFNAERGWRQYVLRGKCRSRRVLSARERLGRLEAYVGEAIQRWLEDEVRIERRLLEWPPEPSQIRGALGEMPQVTLVYTGPSQGGIDILDHGIYEWKPGQERSVSKDLADELLQRHGDFMVHAQAGVSQRAETNGEDT